MSQGLSGMKFRVIAPFVYVDAQTQVVWNIPAGSMVIESTKVHPEDLMLLIPGYVHARYRVDDWLKNRGSELNVRSGWHDGLIEASIERSFVLSRPDLFRGVL